MSGMDIGDDATEIIARQIFYHFTERWGQYAPVTREEADVLALTIRNVLKKSLRSNEKS